MLTKWNANSISVEVKVQLTSGNVEGGRERQMEYL